MDNEIEDNLVKNALLLIDNGEFKLAINLLREVLSSSPGNVEAIKWIAYCFIQLKYFDKAETCYQTLTQLQPTEENIFLLAKTYYELGKDKQALEEFHRVLDLIDYESPFLFEIYKNLGNLYLRSGDVDEAEEHYNRAYTLNSHSDQLMVNYGTLELQKGSIQEATERFQQAIFLNDKNEKGWAGLALVHRLRSDFDLSWGALDKSLDIRFDNIVALKLCIQWSVEDMSFSRAIDRVKTYLLSYPDDTDMIYSLAGLLFHAGRIEDAKVEVNKLISIDPNNQDIKKLNNNISAREARL